MRYLFFSDIHSNLEALRAVLSDAKRRGFDTIVCLGDIVGYGADPNACVETIASSPNTSSCLGNHDAAVIDPREREFLNPVAQAGVGYSASVLTPDNLSFLKSLPLIIENNSSFIASHSSPYKPENWTYILEPVEALDAFHIMTHSVAFIGHTHFPVVHNSSGSVRPIMAGDRVKLHSEHKYIINVGSVGQPRDADPRSSYLIFDDEERVAEVFRVEYDVDKATRKILDAGLPPVLADRIRQGY
ncbi:MAG: metallophosphoesterase family protein [Candidatus Latescibacterota bacterium]|nr:MAG: metallophosphoesterase family protein [Candidatus Latescibacterota bacterium]